MFFPKILLGTPLRQRVMLILFEKLLLAGIVAILIAFISFALSAQLSRQTASDNARVEHLRQLWISVYAYGEQVQAALKSNRGGNALVDATETMDARIRAAGIFLGRARVESLRVRLIAPLVAFTKDSKASQRASLQDGFDGEVRTVLAELENCLRE
jgi:hypothetical protein